MNLLTTTTQRHVNKVILRLFIQLKVKVTFYEFKIRVTIVQLKLLSNTLYDVVI